MTTTPRRIAGASLVRAASLVLLQDRGPLAPDPLHKAVDALLTDHHYEPIELAQVKTALTSLEAQSLIEPLARGSAIYRPAELGIDLLVNALSRMTATDPYAVAAVLSLEARV